MKFGSLASVLTLVLLSAGRIHGFSMRSPHRVSHRPPSTVSFATVLNAKFRKESDSEMDDEMIVKGDPLVKESSRLLRRTSWFSWWSQVILTTIATVILGFSKSVVGTSRQTAAAAYAPPNFFLSGVGIITSAVSIIWTWGNGARLSRRLLKKGTATTRPRAAKLLRRAVQVGVTINLVGLLVTLIAAEEIVGLLAIKVLTNRNGANFMMMDGASALQPLDILVVQANTNTLLSHFFSLASLLYLTDRIRTLDPPSSESIS